MSDRTDADDESPSLEDADDAAAAAPRAPRRPKGAADAAKRLKRRNGRFYLDLRDLGKGRIALIPEGSSYATKDELVAMELAGEVLREHLRPEHERHFGKSSVTNPMTLGNLARAWIARKRVLAGPGASSHNFTSLRTIRRYEQAFVQLFNVLDQDVRADRLTVAMASAAILALRTRTTRNGILTSASSLHQVITGMQVLYDFAPSQGIVPKGHNPWRELPKDDRPRFVLQSMTDFLEVYEAHALLSACDDVPSVEIPLRALTSTYLHTGGRKLEVLGLEVDDLDFVRNLIRFRANEWRTIKDYDERYVPMWPDLKRELQRHLAETTRSSALVFEGRSRSGEPQMITSYHKAFEAAKWAAAARLAVGQRSAFLKKAINPRVFRVTYCSARLQTLDQGQPIAQLTVQSELGHNTDKMIKSVYGRLGKIRHRSSVVEYVPIEADHEETSAPDDSRRAG